MAAPLSGVYSFLDVQVSLVAPSASFILGENGIADEGVTIRMNGEKDTLTMGADGSGMHSMSARQDGRVEITLLKTSPLNAKLSTLYNYQRTSAANWGQIGLSITNPITGDDIECADGAFAKQSDLAFAAEGGKNVWSFNFTFIDEVLGNGYNPTSGVA